MGEETAESEREVDITVEIAGEYEDVVSKLAQSGAAREPLAPVLADFSAVLDTVVELDGGTRSNIADELPGDMNADYEAETVVDVLQILARYDLVTLEGNTWYPGAGLTK